MVRDTSGEEQLFTTIGAFVEFLGTSGRTVDRVIPRLLVKQKNRSSVWSLVLLAPMIEPQRSGRTKLKSTLDDTRGLTLVCANLTPKKKTLVLPLHAEIV